MRGIMGDWGFGRREMGMVKWRMDGWMDGWRGKGEAEVDE